ncbi:DUF1758 domain-containing protein [Trichonephila clavipes]|nr:DUF1758 domain-containing protein [Trichonephila clavipes]
MYTCNFEILFERKICGLVPKINNQNILKELRGKNIDLTDSSCEGAEIDLLIGADVMGRLLTGNVVTLHSGLTAVETKLGWTVFGKQKFCRKDKFTTTLSMHVGNIPLQNLWELEVLGKRHEKMINKLKCGNFFDDYRNIFREWESMKIIEHMLK